MEQLVLILIIALISFVNWLFKKSAELREKRKLERHAMEGGAVPSQAEEPPPASAQGDPDESMRRLMEALGLPQDEAPPPVIRRESSPPPLPPQPVFEAPPSPVATPVPASLPPRLVRSASVPVPTRRSTPSPLRELLTSPEGLKKAIMISEILGKPKSLRS
jgi:hypothetical protein